jgi:hypothetical protein
MSRRFFITISIAFISVFPGAGAVENAPPPKATETASDAKPLKVLFIGNSLTSQNNLPGMLKALCEQSTPPIKLETAQVTQGGYTFEKHWDGGKAQQKIREGGWDVVVLQENSAGPVQKSESMLKYARLFDAEVKKVNAKAVLYMTWALQKSPADQDTITKTYDELGKELGDTVVPVGIARLKAVEGDPTINFYVKDGKHPTPAGTYLAACSFYVALTGHSPKGLPNKIVDSSSAKKTLVDITPEQAAYLQKVAEETVRARATK